MVKLKIKKDNTLLTLIGEDEIEDKLDTKLDAVYDLIGDAINYINQ